MDETTAQQVEQWGLYELSLTGPRDGNLFLDVELSARFQHKHHALEVDGFYDGEGVYRGRFMPDTQGAWTYVTRSNHPQLDGKKGEFTCIEPSPANHGPVHVRDTYHWSYGEYYLYYLGVRQPANQSFKLPKGARYRVDVIDAWEMTITPVGGTFEGKFKIELPGKPHMAVRMRRV